MKSGVLEAAGNRKTQRQMQPDAAHFLLRRGVITTFYLAIHTTISDVSGIEMLEHYRHRSRFAPITRIKE